jgi:hypothetical protein
MDDWSIVPLSLGLPNTSTHYLWTRCSSISVLTLDLVYATAPNGPHTKIQRSVPRPYFTSRQIWIWTSKKLFPYVIHKPPRVLLDCFRGSDVAQIGTFPAYLRQDSTCHFFSESAYGDLCLRSSLGFSTDE